MAQWVCARPDSCPVILFSLSDNLNIMSKQFPAGKGFYFSFFLSISEVVDLRRTGVGEGNPEGKSRKCEVCRLQKISDERAG